MIMSMDEKKENAQVPVFVLFALELPPSSHQGPN